MRSLPADGLKVLNAWKPEQSRGEYVCSVPGGGNSQGLFLLGKVLLLLSLGVGRGKSVQMRLQFKNKQVNKNEQS